MKILIPIILVLFMIQSCSGNSNNPDDDGEIVNNEELEDINAVVEPEQNPELEQEPELEPEQEPEPELDFVELEPEQEPELELNLDFGDDND